MKRVLIITYYWPPNGGAGVYRWLKMAKYLPEHGWQPVIVTPEDPERIAEDAALLADVPVEAEVIKLPITEPFLLYKRFTGKPRNAKLETAFLSERKEGGWKEDLALWVRSNFFIPDARVWWVKPSVRFLKAYLKTHPVDAVITTGPPHSMHLIGRALKRSLGVKWLADFRDPWTDIDFYKQLKLSSWADRRHRRMERSVLSEADRAVAISWSMAQDLGALADRKVQVITNGFDPADVPTTTVAVDAEWSLVHAGSMSATRDLPGLWKMLAGLCASDPMFAERLRLRFIGPVDHSVIDSITNAGLGDRIDRVGRVPHAEAMAHMQRARVLLLPINDTSNSSGILPGKMYEYLSVGRPILAVGPTDGDVARVLGEAHVLIGHEPGEADPERIKGLFVRSASPVSGDIERYSRRRLAGDMAAELEALITGR